jgi:hypothetical protein
MTLLYICAVKGGSRASNVKLKKVARLAWISPLVALWAVFLANEKWTLYSPEDLLTACMSWSMSYIGITGVLKIVELCMRKSRRCDVRK